MWPSLKKLAAVIADIGDFVRHDEMVLRIDGGLHVVADHIRQRAATHDANYPRPTQTDFDLRHGEIPENTQFPARCDACDGSIRRNLLRQRLSIDR